MSEFLASRWPDILFRAWQHGWLVLQALAIATVLAIALAVIATRIKALTPIANAFTAVGLTLPSFALIGVLIPLVGIGTVPAVVVVVFYALLPILRNALVGLRGVDPEVLEAARGMGMGPVALFTRVRLRWPGP